MFPKVSEVLVALVVCVAGLGKLVSGLSFDTDNTTSIHEAQALVAQGLLDYYNGNDTGETPGMFVYGYYWYEAGVAWGSLIDYTYYTGNDTYTDLIKTSMLYQIGSDWNYMPSNQTNTEGNDDQGFWGIAAMDAAEKNFSAPTGGYPGWLYLAQAVFNTMAWRWEPANCGGGLRWQIYTWNNGYDYKNTVSNGCLFNLAARLARFTGNNTYLEWAEKTYNWLVDVNFVYTPTNENLTYVYDGAYIEENCTNVDKPEWTYCYGLFISGSAYLYNYTNDTIWLDRIEMLWQRATVFFENGVMYEAACQPYNKCDTDERCFKGIFARLLGQTMRLAPVTTNLIWPYILTTADALKTSCTGGYDGHTCGLNWLVGKWDGNYGLGEQICALDVLNTLLIWNKPGPLTASTGGTSKGDGAAGSNGTSGSDGKYVTALNLSTKDTAGAAIITVVVLIGMMATSWWLMI